MNQYETLKKKHQEDYNDFPFGWAFGEKQFAQLMEKWKIKAEDISASVVSIGAGGYIKRSDLPALESMLERHRKETQAAIDADQTGEGFIKEMFVYELRNHEYSYTGDASDTLRACGVSEEDLRNKPNLARGLKLAKKQVEKEVIEFC